MSDYDHEDSWQLGLRPGGFIIQQGSVARYSNYAGALLTVDPREFKDSERTFSISLSRLYEMFLEASRN